MTARNENALHAGIDRKLAEVVSTVSPKPAWYRRWKALRPGSADERRLAVYQAIRDSGLLPEDAGFYLVSWQVDLIADKAAETVLRTFDVQLEAIEAAHGLGEDEFWTLDEAPPEYQALARQHHDAWDALFADKLEEHGEHEIARLFRDERAEYDRRDEAGRQFFHGPRVTEGYASDEEWLDLLLEAVSDAVEPESPMGPLMLRYGEDAGFWEVDAYATSVELVGGAHDGAVVAANFSLDLERLRHAFDRIDDAGWNAFGWNDGDGPFVWIEGAFRGRGVWLRILAEAPEGEEPGAKLPVSRKGQE